LNASLPEWLHILSWAYLSLSFVCAAVITGDELCRPQGMMIMNFVWPITALYFGPAALWGYFKSGLKAAKQRHPESQQETQAELTVLTREQVALATTHCGAGCALGDIISEWSVFAMGLTFVGGVFQAVRADTLTVITFEIGLFAWMGPAHYVLFPQPHLRPTEVVFWFMMQVGMIIGFFTSYPANIFLLKTGWKEKMPQYKHETIGQDLNEHSGRSRAA
jgi:hypothetical protein